MGEACDRRWEIDPFRARRLGAKDARSFERHLRTCAACREHLASDERLQQLARALHEDGPSELALRRVRGRVLRDAAAGAAAPGSSGAWPRIGLAAGLAVAAGLGVWAWAPWRATPQAPVAAVVSAAPTASAAEPYAGSIVASDAARWSQERAEGVERVTLREGWLRIHVRRQGPTERFLVVLPDGDLEVRGTTFDVRVDRGATTSVRVDEGIVELRLRDLDTRNLAAGDTWTPAAPPVALAPTPPRPVPPPRLAPIPAPSTPPPSASTDEYSAAMRLLREGHDDEAAAAFHAFAQSQPRASQAEDASFLEAVALARAGRGDAAALAAQHHLASFPASFHRKEACILVARAEAQRGECAKARATLAPWEGDPDVAAALRACQ
jgi:hypothetical protein